MWLQFAAWLGTFLAPIIKPIVMEALNEYFGPDTTEDGALRPDLRAALLERLHGKNENGLHQARGAGASTKDD